MGYVRTRGPVSKDLVAYKDMAMPFGMGLGALFQLSPVFDETIALTQFSQLAERGLLVTIALFCFMLVIGVCLRNKAPVWAIILEYSGITASTILSFSYLSLLTVSHASTPGLLYGITFGLWLYFTTRLIITNRIYKKMSSSADSER